MLSFGYIRAGLTGFALFLFLPTQERVLSIPQPKRIPLIDVGAAARVVYCECRGESIEGQIAVIDVMRNRGERLNKVSRKGMCRGKLNDKYIKLASETLHKPISHGFKYFLNPTTSTDTTWLRIALNRPGKMIGRHWFCE
jgi:hypothetical protein